jgi:hypothetical protein
MDSDFLELQGKAQWVRPGFLDFGKGNIACQQLLSLEVFYTKNKLLSFIVGFARKYFLCRFS